MIKYKSIKLREDFYNKLKLNKHRFADWQSYLLNLMILLEIKDPETLEKLKQGYFYD